MSDNTTRYITAMINAAEHRQPKDFAQNFKDAIRSKIADRLDDERKVVAAQVFSYNSAPEK